MRVLVSAYACEPHKGSEPGIGWNWVKQIAKYHEVWVITRANNREIIEQELKNDQIPNVHFCYLDLPHWMSFWKRGSRGIHLYYYLWQIAAYFLARRLHNQIRFDITHHVTFVNDWMPSFLALLPVPFIWTIGSQEVPAALKSEIGVWARFLEFIKVIARYFDPFFRMTLNRSQAIVAIDPDTASRVPNNYSSKLHIIPAMGISLDELPLVSKERKPFSFEELRILMVGRFIYFKGFTLATKAFAEFIGKYKNARLIFIGEGPEHQRLRKLVFQSRVNTQVDFMGWLPRLEVLKQIQQADILLFPSYEGGGFVVIEALAAGKPVVCLNVGGPAQAVTEECGIKVKVDNPEQIIHGLAEALERLACDSKLRERMGQAARRRIEEMYEWDKKGQEIKEIYDKITIDLNL